MKSCARPFPLVVVGLDRRGVPQLGLQRRRSGRQLRVGRQEPLLCGANEGGTPHPLTHPPKILPWSKKIIPLYRFDLKISLCEYEMAIMFFILRDTLKKMGIRFEGKWSKNVKNRGNEVLKKKHFYDFSQNFSREKNPILTF